jgi:NAD(P)-dependent dehydrogenase (short-subunit alcohol dehydrogenase family)
MGCSSKKEFFNLMDSNYRILITGANRGIGLALTQHLHTQGHTVIAACRESSPELQALAGERLRIVEGVDVGNNQCIDVLQNALQGETLDWVINNAGLLKSMSLQNLDFDAIEAQMQVNAYGPLRVSKACLPALHTGSKIAIITSRMGSIADNDSGGQYGYRMSKSAVNSAGKSLAIDLKPQGIAVGLIHPGFVQTDMTGKQGHIDTDTSAAGILQRIQELNLDNTGSFWHMNGEELPW